MLYCGVSEVGGGGHDSAEQHYIGVGCLNQVSFNHDEGKQHALFGPILSERRLLLFLCCTYLLLLHEPVRMYSTPE